MKLSDYKGDLVFMEVCYLISKINYHSANLSEKTKTGEFISTDLAELNAAKHKLASLIALVYFLSGNKKGN